MNNNVKLAVKSYFTNFFKPSGPTATKFDYVIGFLLYLSTAIPLEIAKITLTKSEDCNTSQDMFCIVKAQVGNLLLGMTHFMISLIFTIGFFSLFSRRVRVFNIAKGPSLLIFIVIALSSFLGLFIFASLCFIKDKNQNNTDPNKKQE